MYRNLSPRVLGFASSIQSEMIELALTYGFTGMDIDIVDFGQQVADFGMDDARRLIVSARLKIGNFILPVRWNEDEETYKRDLARLPGLAGLAAELGCSRSVSSVQPASDTLPFHENFEFHAKRLGEIGAILAEHDISLGLEFLAPSAHRQDKQFEFIYDLPQTMKLLDHVNRPNVGLLVNSFHMHVAGAGADELRELPAERFISVQLADAPADVPTDQLQDTDRKLPGETGVVDNTGILGVLNEKGYNGPVTPAPLRNRVKGMGRQRAVKEAGGLLMRLWTDAGLPPSLTFVQVAQGGHEEEVPEGIEGTEEEE